MKPPRLYRGARLTSWFLRLLVTLIPLAWVGFCGFSSLLDRADFYLARSAPLVSQEVSRSLQRDVRVGHLTPNLSVRSLWSMVRHPEAFGTLPVRADDIVVATHVTKYVDRIKGPVLFDEPRLAGSPVFARARQVTAFVSLPELLTGNVVTSVTRLEIVDPWVVIVRDLNGTFNVTQIVPPRPPSKPSPPFRTVIEVTNGAVRYRDWHSPWPDEVRAAPMQDDLDGIGGTADLSGARIYRFDVKARAAPGTPTVGHLGGGMHLSAVLGRGDVGVRPDGPSPASARYIIHFRAGGANVPYWLYNYLTVGRADPRTPGARDAFRLERGIADVDLTVAAPRPDIKGGPAPGVGFTIAAHFSQGDMSSAFLPVPLRGASGEFRYNDGTLSFNAGGNVLDRRVTASGALWNLTSEAPNTPAKPELSITVHAPSAPVARLARLFVPHLPPGLRVAGDAATDGLIGGSFKDLVAVGSFSRVAASYTGLPAARDISARFAYAGGLITLTDLKAALDGGGSLTGHVAARLFRPTAGDKSGNGAPGDAEFAVRAANVDVATLTALRGQSRMANRSLRLAGRGDVDAVGRRASGTLTAAANISARGLRVGEIPFSVARARVIVRQGGASGLTLVVPAARVESRAGAVAASGNVSPTGALALQWSASSLDLALLSRAVGFSDLRGLVSASGTVGGTLQNPRATVTDAAGINLRLQLPAGSGNQQRRFAVDTLVAHGIVITPRGIAMPRPLVARRFPAVAFVTGNVTGIIGGASPRLNLSASVDNLDFTEIERQTAVRVTVPPAFSAGLSRSGVPLTADAVAARRAPGALTGFITHAVITARGPIGDPRIAGRAALGRILVGSYPVDGGTVDFSYDRTAGTRLNNISLAASAGTVTASAALLPSGVLSGRFNAPALDAEKLSFLTQKVASLGGKVNISGVVSGTTQAPVVTAQIAPSDITVAGIALTDLTARDVRIAVGLEGKSTRVEAALLSFRQVQTPLPGDTGTPPKQTTVHIAHALYEPGSGQFAGDITASADDIGGLVNTLSSSGLRDTESGRALVARLDTLPTPIAGKVSVDRFTVSGRIESRKDAEGATSSRLVGGAGDLSLYGTGIRVGTFTAPTLEARATLRGSKITADRIIAASPATTVRASGFYDTDSGAIQAIVETNEASIDSFRSFAGLQSVPLRGKVDISVEVQGTVKAPIVTASLQGIDIDVVPVSDTVAAAAASSALFRLSVLRATGQYATDASGRGTITLSDVLAEHGKSIVRLEGKIPVSTQANDPGFPDRPVALTASAPSVDLAEFSSLLGAPAPDAKGRTGTAADLGGTVSASVALTGTLREPNLSGNMSITKAHFALPRAPGVSRDVINPVSDFSGSLSLSGQTITVKDLAVVLGGPSGLKGDFGRVDVGGTIKVGSLAALQRLLTKQAGVAADASQPVTTAPDVTENRLNLDATFKGFRPVEDNLFGYGEAVSGVINGTLNITGSPAAPLLKAHPEAPIHVADALLRVSANVPVQKTTAAPPVISPEFNIPIVIDGKAVVADQNQTFRFEANGGATILGKFAAGSASNTASGLNVYADLNVVGGYYQFPLARFTVEKKGSISLRYSPQDSGITANTVMARAKVYTKSGANISLAARASEGGSAVASTYRTPGAATTGYDITVTIDGPLLLLEGPNTGRGGRATHIDFSSNPPLSTEQIIALLGNEDQLRMAMQNNVTGAVTSLVTQSIYSSYLPRALAPLTQGVQSALGLEEFSLDYDPTGYFSTVHLSKRLPGGLDRFMVELTQSVQTRGGQAGTQPFLYSLDYELFQFKPTSRIQPQMRLGVSADEQHTVTYFLRGSVAY